MIAWQAVQLRERQRPRATSALQVDDRIQRSESNAHVRWMRRDTHCRCAEDGVVTIEPLYCVAADTRRTLIAARTVGVVKISAARALEQIPSHGRHIPDLRRCSCEDRARENRIARPDRTIFCERGVAHGGADQNTTAIGVFDRT